MYTVKFFTPALMSCPCSPRFKSLPNAKAYAKQVKAVCEEKKLSYELSIFSKEKTYLEEKVEY